METIKDNVRGPDGTVGFGEVDITNKIRKVDKHKTTKSEGKKRSPPPERPRA